MQPVLRPVGAERLDRQFDVGRGQLRPGAGEQRGGRAAHRQRPLAEQIVVEPDLQFLQVALHHIVDRDREAAAQFERRGIMVLQALADAGQVLHHRDAERGELVLRADPG